MPLIRDRVKVYVLMVLWILVVRATFREKKVSLKFKNTFVIISK